MKASRYNNYVEKGDYAYWFNPLYQTYFRLPKTLGKKVYHIININNGGNLKNISQPFYDNLVNNGFLVPKEQDELKVLREKFQRSVESKQAFLIIAPTLNCNYSCWYCIQNHIPSIMDADTIERVKKHIKYLIEVEKIESLHIDWFGGEPFMFFEKVIVPIAEYAIEICEKASIPFYNSATSNAYYINEKISQMLGNLKFRTFQITLDGNREFHDKVKFMKGLDSSFNHGLKNINQFLHDNEEITVALRINYTHDNISHEIVNQVCEHIQEDVRARIKIFARKVWQENPIKDYGKEIFYILQLFKNKGFKIEVWSPVESFIPCYASQRIYKTINYNGSLVKCTANDDLYSSTPLGYLNENGEAIWNVDMNASYCAPGFENDRYLNCSILPACM